MVIIEGPDGSGKSTLARKIRDKYGFTLIHSPGPCDESAWKERMFWTSELLSIDKMVMDRSSVVSEYVYGNILRGKSHATLDDVSEFVSNFLDESHRNIFVLSWMKFEHEHKKSGAVHLTEEEKIQFEKDVDLNIESIKNLYNVIFIFFDHPRFVHLTECKDYVKLYNLVEER